MQELFVVQPDIDMFVMPQVKAFPVGRECVVMEGLVNSIIHCDFAANGVLRIERRTDSIIMRNPGNLRISREKIYEGDRLSSVLYA